MKTWRKDSGVTLTEILLALLILAVLATAAVSETLQSKTRTDVARVRADMQKVAMALEAYAMDQQAYPFLDVFFRLSSQSNWPGQFDRGEITLATCLSTPVAYLGSVDVKDPFYKAVPPPVFGPTIPEAGAVNYCNVDLYYRMNRRPKNPQYRFSWYLISLGPDRYRSLNLGGYITRIDSDQSCRHLDYQYDPSNGVMTSGDIVRYSTHY